MDSFDELVKWNIFDIFCRRLKSFAHYASVVDKARHLASSTTIAKLQVVEHGVVVFCETLVGILDPCNISAHFVGVISHVCNGHMSILS